MDYEIKNRISLDRAIQGNAEGVTLADAYSILSQNEKNEEGVTDASPGREEADAAVYTPLSITGVENSKIIEIGIDYLKFTIYAPKEKVFEIYSNIFADKIGELNLEGQTKIYENRYLGANGFAILTNPKFENCKNHCIIDIPGKACELITLENLEDFMNIRTEEGINIRCIRLDLRADGCPFTPLQVYNAILDGKAETRTTRATLKKFTHPFDIRDNGQTGSEGMTLGSRESERFLRIYNKHGFTRFELECKGDTANIYFSNLIKFTANFNDITMGIFQDFIRIDADFWRQFIGKFKRTYMKINIYQDPTLSRLEKYLNTQAAAAIGILYQIKGEKWLKEIANKGYKIAQNNRKYYPLLHAYGLDI